MQVGKENAELALSLVGYSDELKVCFLMLVYRFKPDRFMFLDICCYIYDSYLQYFGVLEQ